MRRTLSSPPGGLWPALPASAPPPRRCATSEADRPDSPPTPSRTGGGPPLRSAATVAAGLHWLPHVASLLRTRCSLARLLRGLAAVPPRRRPISLAAQAGLLDAALDAVLRGMATPAGSTVAAAAELLLERLGTAAAVEAAACCEGSEWLGPCLQCEGGLVLAAALPLLWLLEVANVNLLAAVRAAAPARASLRAAMALWVLRGLHRAARSSGPHHAARDGNGGSSLLVPLLEEGGDPAAPRLWALCTVLRAWVAGEPELGPPVPVRCCWPWAASAELAAAAAAQGVLLVMGTGE